VQAAAADPSQGSVAYPPGSVPDATVLQTRGMPIEK